MPRRQLTTALPATELVDRQAPDQPSPSAARSATDAPRERGYVRIPYVRIPRLRTDYIHIRYVRMAG